MSDLFTFESLNQQFQELNKLTQNEKQTEKEAGKLTEGTSILPTLPIVSELYPKLGQVGTKLEGAYTEFQKFGTAVANAQKKMISLAKETKQARDAQQATTETTETPSISEQPYTASMNEGATELSDLSNLGRAVSGGSEVGIGSETSLANPLRSVASELDTTVSDTVGALRSGVSSAISDTVGAVRSSVGSAIESGVSSVRSAVMGTDINSLLPSGAGAYVDLSGTSEGLQTVARSALSDAQGGLLRGVQGVQGTGEDVLSSVRSAVQGAGQDILSTVQQTGQSALSSGQSALSAVQQVGEGALSAVQESAQGALSGVEGAISSGSSALNSLASSGLSGIASGSASEAVQGVGSAAANAIGSAGSGINNAVSAVGSALGVDTGAITGAVSGAVQAGTAAVETGTAVASGVLSTVGEVLGPIGALAAIGMGIYDIFSASENHHQDAVASPTFTAGL